MSPMRTAAQAISWLTLAGLLLAAVLFFADRATLAQMKAWMLALTCAWFVATPLWMERKPKGGERLNSQPKTRISVYSSRRKRYPFI